MRLDPSDWNKRRERQQKGVKLPPLRTLSEMADEFGVTPRSLTVTMGYYPGAPEPMQQLKSTATRTGNTWYDPAAMRKWWKSVQEARSQKNNTSS